MKEREAGIDLAKALTTVPPASMYGDISQSNRFDITYELQDTTPIDGSNENLRAYSPFILEVVPPLVFGGDPALEEGITPNKVGLIGAAQKAYNPYRNAKGKKLDRSLRQMSFIGDGQREAFEKVITLGNMFRKTSGDKSKFVGQGDPFSDPTIADAMVAADIGLQLNNILRTPPLVLLINPNTLAFAHNKIQQYTERTRYGYVFQAHGEEQPKISVSGVIGAYLAGARVQDRYRAFEKSKRGSNSSVTGVQFASKRDSASYQNLMNLFSMYMSSGYIFDTVGKSATNHFVGALAIRYDGWVYVGHIESFSYQYEESKPNGGMGFDFEFTASQLFDTTQTVQTIRPLRAPTSSPSDPKYGALGALPGLVATNVAKGAALHAAARATVKTEANKAASAPVTSKPSRKGFQAPAANIVSTSFTPSAQPFAVG